MKAKKLLSMLLALVMVFSLIPTMAFATAPEYATVGALIQGEDKDSICFYYDGSPRDSYSVRYLSHAGYMKLSKEHYDKEIASHKETHSCDLNTDFYSNSITAIEWFDYDEDGTYDKVEFKIGDNEFQATLILGTEHKPSDSNICKNCGKALQTHSHDWEYSLVGTDTIKAHCKATGHTGDDVTLTLTASEVKYSGEAATASFDSAEAATWEEVTGNKVPTITYTAKAGSSLTDGKAVNVGSYTASVTVGTATASADFEIKQPAKLFETNTYWDFNSTTGTLTISGTGAMPDFTLSEGGTTNSPWDSFRGDITSVVVEDGVTTVGKEAFYKCTSLNSAMLGNTVEVIGEGAFECSGIEEITIPDSVKTIDEGAFYDCASLASVQFGNGVKTIGNTAFYKCASLESIVIGNGVETIGSWAFAYTGLKEVTIPDSVKKICNSTFYGCEKLESVVIGKGVETIDSWAFAYTGLKEVTIPDSVKTINFNAFYGCEELESVVIGKGVTTIGIRAFGYFRDGENEVPVESFIIKGYGRGEGCVAYKYFVDYKGETGWTYINLLAAPIAEDSEFTVENSTAKLTFVEKEAKEATLHIDGIELVDVYKAQASTVYDGVVVTCDGTPLTQGVDYTVTEGSVKINFQKAFLDTLSVGVHTIKTYIKGNAVASDTVNDYAFESKIVITSKSTPAAPAPAPATPKTDDTFSRVGYIALMAVSAMGLAVVAKKKED